jgi:glycosyltransferase involved in cell wall biosynthesis
VKIVVVHNTYQQPGGEDIVFELERKMLEAEGHDVVAYRRSNHEIEELSAVGRVFLIKRMIWASDTYRDFSQLLEREKPDVVHIHNTFVMISPSIYAACREALVPVIQSLHNFRFFCAGAEFARNGSVCEECLEHGVWRGVRYGCYRGSKTSTAAVAAMLTWHRARGTWDEAVSTYIALTEFSRSKFIEGGLPEDRVVVKPNFIDPDPGAGGHDRSCAIFVGRLSPTKGIKTLVAALGRLQGSVPFAMIGGGPDRPEFEAEAERCGVPVSLFLGQLPRPQTIAAMQTARFLVFPSEWYENFPMTIAEAFACATPVLCSRLGSMKEIVTDGVTGLHFNPRDPGDLAAKMTWAWEHPEQMREMGQNARHEYELKYTAEKNYSRLLTIYENAIRCYA